jgi:hypothetical protein
MFPQPMRRDIVLLICIKAVAHILLYYAFVVPVAQPEPDGGAMAAHLLHGSGN